jgi:hypothetical protein
MVLVAGVTALKKATSSFHSIRPLIVTVVVACRNVGGDDRRQRGERGAATAIRASLMDMTENPNSRKGYLRNYMRANTASSGKISLSKQHAPVGSLIEPSATSR